MARPMAGPGDHAGQQRRRQGQVGAERQSRQDADGAERQRRAGTEAEGPDEHHTRREHRAGPGARFAEAPRQRNPQRHRQRRRAEVQDQEQTGQCRQAQAVGGKKQEQRGGNRRGDAIHQQHRKQGAKARLGKRRGQRAPVQLRRAIGDSGRTHRFRQQRGAHYQRGAERERQAIVAGQRGDGGGQHHPKQAAGLAHPRHAGAVGQRVGQRRAPALVRDRRQAETEVHQRQGGAEPGKGGGFRHRRRMEQPEEAGQQKRQRERDVAPVGAASAPDPPTQQRVDKGGHDARRQQRGADQCQRQAGALGVELRQVDVDGQRDHGERQAEEAVTQQVGQPERGHRGVATRGAASFRSATRSAGAVVFGSSQMPKKAVANPGSAIVASGLPSR